MIGNNTIGNNTIKFMNSILPGNPEITTNLNPETTNINNYKYTEGDNSDYEEILNRINEIEKIIKQNNPEKIIEDLQGLINRKPTGKNTTGKNTTDNIEQMIKGLQSTIKEKPTLPFRDVREILKKELEKFKSAMPKQDPLLPEIYKKVFDILTQTIPAEKANKAIEEIKKEIKATR